jgi:hypothetical protein
MMSENAMSEPRNRRGLAKDPSESEQDRQDEHREEELDEALEESFPASDPPSPTQPSDHARPGSEKKS